MIYQKYYSLVSKSIYPLYFLGTCLRDETIPRNTDIDIDGTEDSVPVIRNPIDRINITAGELLRYKVPEVRIPILLILMFKELFSTLLSNL